MREVATSVFPLGQALVGAALQGLAFLGAGWKGDPGGGWRPIYFWEFFARMSKKKREKTMHSFQVPNAARRSRPGITELH